VQELNTEPLNGLFNGVMANVSQQCTQYITSSAVSAARRRLLQAGAASVTATVSSNTPEVRRGRAYLCVQSVQRFLGSSCDVCVWSVRFQGRLAWRVYWSVHLSQCLR
jgi:hypothetical protein